MRRHSQAIVPTASVHLARARWQPKSLYATALFPFKVKDRNFKMQPSRSASRKIDASFVWPGPVNDSVGGSEQTRAYAEYRVFASAAPYSRLVREVEVVVSANAGDAPAVLCDVRVQLDSGPRVNVHARGGHAYEAINRAADRVSQQLSKRVGAPEAAHARPTASAGRRWQRASSARAAPRASTRSSRCVRNKRVGLSQETDRLDVVGSDEREHDRRTQASAAHGCCRTTS
jgi:ribosome-associated translation inhibitor RaiA